MYRSFAMLLCAAGMTLESPDLTDGLKKYREKYEEEYQQDVKDRMESHVEPAAMSPSPSDEVLQKVLGDSVFPATGAAPETDQQTEQLLKTAAESGLMDQHVMTETEIKEAMEKMRASVKMMVVLHVLLKPIATKLSMAMAKMPEKEKAQAENTLKHMSALDKLSKTSVNLLAAIDVLEKSPPETQEEGLGKIALGMRALQNGVHAHLAAMKQPHAKTHNSPALARLDALTLGLHTRMHELQEKVDREKADPAREGDPMVAIDEESLDTMKKTIKRVEALVVVSAVAMKQAKTPKDQEAIKHGVKEEMKKAILEMREKMKDLKKKSIMALTIKALKQEDEQAGYDEDASAAEDERIPKLRRQLEAHYANTYGGKDGAPKEESEKHALEDDHDGEFKSLLSQLDRMNGAMKKDEKKASDAKKDEAVPPPDAGDAEEKEKEKPKKKPEYDAGSMGKMLEQLDALKAGLGLPDGHLRSH